MRQAHAKACGQLHANSSHDCIFEVSWQIADVVRYGSSTRDKQVDRQAHLLVRVKSKVNVIGIVNGGASTAGKLKGPPLHIENGIRHCKLWPYNSLAQKAIDTDCKTTTSNSASLASSATEADQVYHT